MMPFTGQKVKVKTGSLPEFAADVYPVVAANNYQPLFLIKEYLRMKDKENKQVIHSRVQSVKDRINQAAIRAGRDPLDVELICVTKQACPEEVLVALEDGACLAIGENRVQDALRKQEFLRQHLDPDRFNRLRWHMIGHLQTNKAARALEIFHTIQSVDSKRLAEVLSRRMRELNRSVDILLEINISRETGKYGFEIEAAEESAREIKNLPGLNVRGLMGMAPYVAAPELARPFFAALYEIFSRLKQEWKSEGQFTELSMGMTNDFDVAVEEGATMVRVGSAIFGEQS